MKRLAFIAIVLVVGCNRPQATPPSPEPPDLDFPVGPFAFTERSGKPITDADLKGKVWVACFVFTRCAEPCPRVMATMAQLQRDLPPSDDLRLVTFTIDPEYDTPPVLRKYAENFNADPDRWLFITGPEADIHAMLLGRFKQAVEKNPDPQASVAAKYFHSSRLAVVDKKGTVRAVFDGVVSLSQPNAKSQFDQQLTRLKAKVAQLLEE